MKTKEEKTVKKIELNKLKVASLSRDQKNQVVGGSRSQSFWSICIVLK